MAHAGIPCFWTMKEARRHAMEVEEVLQGPACESYFQQMYGNEPDHWQESWDGMQRWRVITNCFTRMRLMSVDGRLDFSHKGSLVDAPAGLVPWYQLRAERPLKSKILFGHWAALEGHTGLDDIISLDTGCVWGRTLTALCLEDGRYLSVDASPEPGK